MYVVVLYIGEEKDLLDISFMEGRERKGRNGSSAQGF